MQTRITITAAVLALIFGLGEARAQGLANAQPAEFPPASYTGKQYVDSRGCVFVRAGFDGALVWVPRVSGQRKQLCGMVPTFAASPPAEPLPQVVVAPPRVTPPPRAVAPQPPAPVATKPPAPPARIAKPVRSRTVTVAPTVRPRTVIAPVQTRKVVPPVQTRRVVPPVQTRRVVPPRSVAPSGISYHAAPQSSRDAILAVRVAPPPKIAPPPGYKPAWEDDRLNPYRGVQTAEGYYQSSLIWTNTVPRRLIDQRTRRDVTGLFASLRYPQMPTRTMAEQVGYRLDIGENPPARVVYVTGKPVPVAGQSRVSTKAVPPAQPGRVKVIPGHRYVQVGAFASPGHAQTAAARLQRAGLPVRMGSYQRSGTTYRVVLAGPFDSPERLAGGLVAARRAGFPDAVTRK